METFRHPVELWCDGGRKIGIRRKAAVMVVVNPFKPSGVKWLHFEVLMAILV